MKVLCFTDSLGSGGAQRQLVNLAVGFKEKGHDVTFLVYHDADFYLPDLQKAHIPVTKILESNYAKRVFKVRKYIRFGGFDAVLSFLEPPSFIAELSAFPYKKWKLIVGERSADPKIMFSFKRKLFRWFHLLADYVVANSNENIKMVKKINPLLSNNKCKVIYNYVDEERWELDKDYSALKDGKLQLIVAASHQYLKNAKGLIEALNLLSNEEKQIIKVSWFGDKSPDNSHIETKVLMEKYNLQEMVSLYPADLNIQEKIINSDVLGLFSFYEGLPNVICEAMTAGKAVIASNISDISLFIDNRLIFNPNDVFDIKDKISYLISLDQKSIKEIGRYNRLKAKDLFDKNSIVTSYIKLFGG